MKKTCLFILILFICAGCSQRITEDDLIGGEWIATSGYEDGKIVGEPNCYPFEDGIEFKNKNTVYIESYKRDFNYELKENGSEITFRDYGPHKDSSTSNPVTTYYNYEIKIISDNEMYFVGRALNEENTCYLERKPN